MTNDVMTTYHEMGLDEFDSDLVQQYTAQRVEAISLHLQAARAAMRRAQDERMFVIGDLDDAPPAYEALRDAEAALVAVNDCLGELDTSAETITRFVSGVVAVCQEFKVQRDAALSELDSLNATLETRINEQVEGRINEIMLDQLAIAGALDKDNIRALVDEIREADWDVDGVIASRRADDDRLYEAARRVAMDAYTRETWGDDNNEQDDHDDE